MAWFSKTVKKEVAPSTDGPTFYPFNAAMSLTWDYGQDEKKLLKGFLEVPELNSIIVNKARAFASMKLEVVSKATGKPAANNDPLVKLFRRPNYFQSQKEFLFQTKLFAEIFGNEIIYFLTPTPSSTNYKGMFTLPPYMVDIEEQSQERFWLNAEMSDKIKYSMTWGGQKYPLNNSEIIHMNNAKVDIKEGNVFWGTSQINSLSAPIANLRAAYEARNVLIENRGALGILSNAGGGDAMGRSLPLDDTEKKALQNAYKNYGLSKEKWNIIITSLNLKWQQMTIDADKLQLFEETKYDTEKICDAFGYPFELLANQKGSTFENQKQARKSLYEDTVIPEAMEWVDSLNAYFETDGRSWHITGSFDHLTVFSDNQKERATALTLLTGALSKAFLDGAITLDEYKFELQKMKIGK